MGVTLPSARVVAGDDLRLAEARLYRSAVMRVAATLALAQYYGELSASDASAHLRQRAGLWWRADPPAEESDAWRASLVRLSDRLIGDAEAHVARMPATAARESYESHLRGWRLSLRVARDTGRDLFEPLSQVAAVFDLEMVRDPAGLWRVLEQIRTQAANLVREELSRPLATSATGAAGTGTGPLAPSPAPVTPSAMPPAGITPPVSVGTPVAVAPLPSPPPQGVAPTRPLDYVSLPQPGSQTGGLIGCFADANDRDLSGFTFNDARMTVGTCRATCASKGFAYAAVQFGSHCFCGNSYGKYGPSNACTMPCAGAASETCGGSYANLVYSTRGAAGAPPAPPSSMPPLDLGTWWSEEESGLRGAWVRRPRTTTFDAYWPGNFVKATIEVVSFGPQIRLRRSQGSDGYECEYTGTRNGSEINGTFGCNRAPGPMPWRAWIQGASAAPPGPVVPPVTGGNVPSLTGTWAVACCNDALTGTMTITQQQGGSFSGIMEGGLLSQSVVGRVQGDLVEFDRRTDEGPQRWSGRLVGSGPDLRIVGGVWSGAYEGRFAQGQRNWHAEKR
jgi:hypothetical protein